MISLETWQNEINLDLVVLTPVTENVLERNLFFKTCILGSGP